MLIVCATDFTQRSQAALGATVALAARLKASEVWLIHVLDPELREIAPGAEEQLRRALAPRLDEQVAELKNRTRAPVHPAMLSGPTARTLCEFALAKKADLLVLGSPGHADAPLYRLGGTTERVAQAATVPVLVARDSSPFTGWTAKQRELRILVGVDESLSAASAVKLAKQIAEAGDTHLSAALVYYAVEAAKRYGLRHRRAWLEADPEVEALLVRDLERFVGKAPNTSLRFVPKLAIGRLGDHLLHLAESDQSDLIVVGTRHRRGLGRLGSVSSVVLHSARASVLIVPLGVVHTEAVDVRHIMVATDFSPAGNRAVDYAYGLLAGRGGQVHIVHVRSDRETRSDDTLREELRRLIPETLPEGVSTETSVLSGGKASELLCQQAERSGVDLICIGPHSRSDLERLALGSTADFLVRTSRKPVLIVRAE